MADVVVFLSLDVNDAGSERAERSILSVLAVR